MATLQELDKLYIAASEWEQVLLSTETSIVKVVKIRDEEYRVLVYRLDLINGGWRCAFAADLDNPMTDEVFDAVAGAMRKI